MFVVALLKPEIAHGRLSSQLIARKVD